MRRSIGAITCCLLFALLMPAVSRSDGEIVVWGDNGQGQCNVPAPNAGFVALAAGAYHSLGLKAMPPVPGDLGGDRDVDIADFSLFQQAFSGPQ